MFMYLRRWAVPVIFLFIFFFGAISTAVAASCWPLLDEVRALTLDNYVEPIGQDDAAVMEEGAVRGFLDTLGDPYSEYISPGELEDFENAMNDEFVGVGIVFRESGGQVVIVEVIPGSPAARMGVEAGSVLVEVDGRPVEGMPFKTVADILKGDLGTYLDFKVKEPENGSLRGYYLRREIIRPPVVASEIFTDKIGYLSLRSFPKWSVEEVDAALKYLQASGSRGLILDLRDNPGGYLNAAVDIASRFLLKGKTVVRMVDRDQKVTEIKSRGPGLDLPMVVLVNKETASAAEILAGALQANGSALVVGTSTYGKGVVQSLFPLSNGGALKLTTAFYLTPDDRVIHEKGLQPDIEIEDEQEQLNKASEVLRQQVDPYCLPAGIIGVSGM